MGASNATAKIASKERSKHVSGNEQDNQVMSHKRKQALGAFYTTVMEDVKGIGLQDFQLLKVVGQGSYGKVCQVRFRKNQQIYAMKILRKDTIFKKEQQEHTKTERRILEKIDHPFIVSLRYAFQTPDKLYLVLDYFVGGELFYHLKASRGFDEERAKFYGAETLLAMEHLHSLNIIYRDLKPENVLLDEEGHIVLTDFGLAKEGIELPNATKTFCGTPEYMSPEALKNNAYGKPIDIWSFGNFMYEMVLGRPPFYNRNRQEMYDRILKQEPKFPSWTSHNFQDLIKKILQKEPDQRPSLKEIKNHVFFEGINWEKLLKKKVAPPFIPKVSNPEDCSNFEDAFTKMTPKDTPVEESLESYQRSKFLYSDYFDEFTYEDSPTNQQ